MKEIWEEEQNKRNWKSTSLATCNCICEQKKRYWKSQKEKEVTQGKEKMFGKKE